MIYFAVLGTYQKAKKKKDCSMHVFTHSILNVLISLTVQYGCRFLSVTQGYELYALNRPVQQSRVMKRGRFFHLPEISGSTFIQLKGRSYFQPPRNELDNKTENIR